MHGDSPPLKVHEPITSERFADGEWWTGVGNLALIGEDVRLLALRLSRSIPHADFSSVIDCCLEAAANGYVPISTFISPCERALKDSLVAAGAPMVRAVSDPLTVVYRPKEDEPRLFAAGKLLLLSRIAGAETSRYEAWHGINDALAKIAGKCGMAAYVRRAEDAAALKARLSGRQRVNGRREAGVWDGRGSQNGSEEGHGVDEGRGGMLK